MQKTISHKKMFIVFGFMLALIGFIVMMSVFSTANAVQELKLRAQAQKYDPGHTGEVLQAAWVNGEGENGDQGLVLNMASTVVYPPGASADATIINVAGHTLDSLAFDHKLGTACTGGSPRWSVETEGGSFAFGCASGTHSIIGMPLGWERITFSDADVQNLSGTWTSFASGPTITFLQVLQDEGGSTTLDNLSVGIDDTSFIFTKPGMVSGQ